MDRPAVIQTSGSVWITGILVWIGGMYRPVGSGYGSGFYILTRSHLAQPLLTRQGQLSKTQICYSHLRLPGARHITAEHVGIWKGFLRELLVCSAACPSFIKLWCPRPRPMVSKLEAKALSERGPKSLCLRPPYLAKFAVHKWQSNGLHWIVGLLVHGCAESNIWQDLRGIGMYKVESLERKCSFGTLSSPSSPQ